MFIKIDLIGGMDLKLKYEDMVCREKVDFCVYNEKDISFFVSFFEIVGCWKLIKIGYGIDVCL